MPRYGTLAGSLAMIIPSLLLAGVRFIERIGPVDNTPVYLMEPSPSIINIHPSLQSPIGAAAATIFGRPEPTVAFTPIELERPVSIGMQQQPPVGEQISPLVVSQPFASPAATAEEYPVTWMLDLLIRIAIWIIDNFTILLGAWQLFHAAWNRRAQHDERREVLAQFGRSLAQELQQQLQAALPSLLREQVAQAYQSVHGNIQEASTTIRQFVDQVTGMPQRLENLFGQELQHELHIVAKLWFTKLQDQLQLDRALHETMLRDLQEGISAQFSAFDTQLDRINAAMRNSMEIIQGHQRTTTESINDNHEMVVTSLVSLSDSINARFNRLGQEIGQVNAQVTRSVSQQVDQLSSNLSALTQQVGALAGQLVAQEMLYPREQNAEVSRQLRTVRDDIRALSSEIRSSSGHVNSAPTIRVTCNCRCCHDGSICEREVVGNPGRSAQVELPGLENSSQVSRETAETRTTEETQDTPLEEFVQTESRLVNELEPAQEVDTAADISALPVATESETAVEDTVPTLVEEEAVHAANLEDTVEEMAVPIEKHHESSVEVETEVESPATALQQESAVRYASDGTKATGAAKAENEPIKTDITVETPKKSPGNTRRVRFALPDEDDAPSKDQPTSERMTLEATANLQSVETELEATPSFSLHVTADDISMETPTQESSTQELATPYHFVAPPLLSSTGHNFSFSAGVSSFNPYTAPYQTQNLVHSLVVAEGLSSIDTPMVDVEKEGAVDNAMDTDMADVVEPNQKDQKETDEMDMDEDFTTLVTDPSFQYFREKWGIPNLTIEADVPDMVEVESNPGNQSQDLLMNLNDEDVADINNMLGSIAHLLSPTTQDVSGPSESNPTADDLETFFEAAVEGDAYESMEDFLQGQGTYSLAQPVQEVVPTEPNLQVQDAQQEAPSTTRVPDSEEDFSKLAIFDDLIDPELMSMGARQQAAGSSTPSTQTLLPGLSALAASIAVAAEPSNSSKEKKPVEQTKVPEATTSTVPRSKSKPKTQTPKNTAHPTLWEVLTAVETGDLDEFEFDIEPRPRVILAPRLRGAERREKEARAAKMRMQSQESSSSSQAASRQEEGSSSTRLSDASPETQRSKRMIKGETLQAEERPTSNNKPTRVVKKPKSRMDVTKFLAAQRSEEPSSSSSDVHGSPPASAARLSKTGRKLPSKSARVTPTKTNWPEGSAREPPPSNAAEAWLVKTKSKAVVDVETMASTADLLHEVAKRGEDRSLSERAAASEGAISLREEASKLAKAKKEKELVDVEERLRAALGRFNAENPN